MNKQELKDLLKSETLEFTFGASHSLLAPNIPENVDATALSDSMAQNFEKDQVQQFGLFGGESQYNHFNPEVKAEDWTPKDSDYVYPMFRVLSETIVSKFGIPIDFSKKGVLKAALSKLPGITVYPDHKNDEVGNHLGVIVNATWQKAFEQDGMVIPAGLNAVLKVDAKSNPRIARGILSEPPSIHSGSVKVNFGWEQSHKEMDKDDFFEKLGTLDDKGNLHRVVVTEIKHLEEYSLVSRGADPYAQKIDSTGGINNPRFVQTNFSASSEFLNFKDLNQSFEFSNFKTPKKMDLINLIKPKLPANWDLTGIETEEALVDLIATKVSELSLEIQTLQADSMELQELKEVLPELSPDKLRGLSNVTPVTEDQQTVLSYVTENGGLERIQALAKDGNTYLENIRNSAISSYKLCYGDKANPDLIELIQKADLKAAKTFETQFLSEVETKLPLTCKSCGSDEVTRASHEMQNKPRRTSVSEDAKEEFKKTQRKPSDLHQ